MKQRVFVNLVVSDIAAGTKRCYVETRVDGEAVLAHCLWLESHGKQDEADLVLDCYVTNGTLPTGRHA